MVDCSTLKIIPTETANTIFANSQFQNLLRHCIPTHLLFKISSTSLGLQIYLLDPFTYTDCVFKKVNNSYEMQA